eukprot:CAMPEP_0174262130 /NCGR_PEP_ID=MMETSP0439-20130205/12792_1 /TAXON_ID=0 /ORGANISM="Stereomyxa ramosa, Strain Chinc5" /LENGTH=97 /DNA_ID=CAMNT_0015346779 /DNA_START=77 /DNA_END=367 /DNA_ORIENTATION=+
MTITKTEEEVKYNKDAGRMTAKCTYEIFNRKEWDEKVTHPNLNGTVLTLKPWLPSDSSPSPMTTPTSLSPMAASTSIVTTGPLFLFPPPLTQKSDPT